MEKHEPDILSQIDAPDFAPDQMGAQFWYEQYLQQREENRQLRTQLSQLQGEVEHLKEALCKLTNRNSENSSKPPSADAHKKKSKDVKSRKKKPEPQYGHEGKTRNGFGCVDHTTEVELERCPQCGNHLSPVADAPVRKHQIAELVTNPVEIGVTIPAGGIAYGKDLHFPQTRIPSLHVHGSIWNVGGISA